MNKKLNAFKAAFPYTVPIFAGFIFLGFAYGIYMNKMGFSFVYPMLMAMIIFAGSMEFVAANLLLQSFNPLNALILTLVINARHLFYGISMLKEYSNVGKKRIFLIFGMCDESFSINFSIKAPEGIDKGWFMFFVTLLNYSYWVIGSALGGIFGSYITFNTRGIEFVMTALFVVIFLEQWNSQKEHSSALIGLGVSTLCLVIFGVKNFIIPSMLLILILLSFYRKADNLNEQEVTL